LKNNPKAKAMISVSTKVLQEQLEKEDIPKVAKYFSGVKYCQLKANSD
jgi:Rad3-related DNA helicase